METTRFLKFQSLEFGSWTLFGPESEKFTESSLHFVLRQFFAQ